MHEAGNSSPLRAIEIEARGIRVRYSSGKNHEATYQPSIVRIGYEGIFIPWREAPERLQDVTVEWQDNPFMAETFAASCRVARSSPEGLDLSFTSPPATAFRAWLASISGILFRESPDAAIRTSQLYTLATVVSACGLFCGAMAILLPIVVGDQGWVDSTAKILLVLMVASIGAFALIRLLAGRQEIKAIGQGRG